MTNSFDVSFSSKNQTADAIFESGMQIQFQSEASGGSGSGGVNVISDGDPSPIHAWSSQKVDNEIQRVREGVAENARDIVDLRETLEDISAGAASGEQIEANTQAIAAHEETLQELEGTIDGKMDEPIGEKSEGRIPMTDAHGNVVWVDQTISGSIETANQLKFAREIRLTGQISGVASFDGSSDIEIHSVVSNMTNEELEGMLRL